MTLNDGGGLYDKYGMIQSVIDDLNRVQVCGYQNMRIIIGCAQRLQALKEGMKKEEMPETEEKREND